MQDHAFNTCIEPVDSTAATDFFAGFFRRTIARAFRNEQSQLDTRTSTEESARSDRRHRLGTNVLFEPLARPQIGGLWRKDTPHSITMSNNFSSLCYSCEE
jgi:hypothetical protein